MRRLDVRYADANMVAGEVRVCASRLVDLHDALQEVLHGRKRKRVFTASLCRDCVA